MEHHRSGLARPWLRRPQQVRCLSGGRSAFGVSLSSTTEICVPCGGDISVLEATDERAGRLPGRPRRRPQPVEPRRGLIPTGYFFLPMADLPERWAAVGLLARKGF